MIEDAFAHGLVVSAEDGIVRRGRRICRSRPRCAMPRPPARARRVVNCGVPTAYLPHGRASGILSGLGLDGQGLTRMVLQHL